MADAPETLRSRLPVWAMLAGALILGLGLAGAGFLIGRGFEQGRSADRYVTVKGLAETFVYSEKAQPLTMPVWFMTAPAKDTVLLWQVSQPAVVVTCFAGLPKAVLPLWQVAQPLTMPLWLKFAGVHAVVVWQFSHVLSAAM